MLFASTSDAAMLAERIERLRVEDQARRSRFANRHLLLTDDYAHLVQAEVRRIFADPTRADRVSTMADTTLNVFKYWSDELFRFTGAKRDFLRDGQPDPVYRQILERFEFDIVGQEYTTAIGAENDALVQILPGLVDDLGTVGMPRVRVFRPHECSVIHWDSDPSQPRVVTYEIERTGGGRATVVWTDTEHYIVGPKGEYELPRLPNGETGDGTNPLGRLPFVAAHKGMRPDRFWDDSTGEDIILFTLQFLASWAALDFLCHTQSFKQLAAINVPADWEPPAKMGPGTLWVVTASPGAQPARFEAVDVNSDPTSIRKKLESQLKMKCASLGLNAEALLENTGQAPPSGLARYVERQTLLERRKKIRPFQVEAEFAIADLYRAMWNWNHEDKIAEDAEFACELIEETVVLSPMEIEDVEAKRLGNIAKQRELGLKTETEQIAESRGISLDEAAKLADTLKAKPTIYAYDQENGVLTLDEVRASKGLGAHPNRELGALTVPEIRAKYPAMFGAGGTASAPAAQE
jgi:hypothetical protein